MMTELALRHLVAMMATFVCALAFYSGYVAGAHGWWWVVFSMLIIYGVVYKIVDAGGHGGKH